MRCRRFCCSTELPPQVDLWSWPLFSQPDPCNSQERSPGPRSPSDKGVRERARAGGFGGAARRSPISCRRCRSGRSRGCGSRGTRAGAVWPDATFLWLCRRDAQMRRERTPTTARAAPRMLATASRLAHTIPCPSLSGSVPLLPRPPLVVALHATVVCSSCVHCVVVVLPPFALRVCIVWASLLPPPSSSSCACVGGVRF